MIPTQTLDQYPVFGNASSKEAPESAKYAAGFQQADVLPAEWMNWAWNKNSKGITDLNSGVTSMETELNAVLTAGGVTPSAETNDQVLEALRYIIRDEMKGCLPIGFTYAQFPGDPTPQEMGLKGTWEVKQMAGMFFRAEGGNALPFTGAFSCSISGTAVIFNGSVKPTSDELKVGLLLICGNEYRTVTAVTVSSGTITACTVDTAYTTTKTTVMVGYGEERHTLTVGEMPGHSHTTNSQSASTTGGMSANSTGAASLASGCIMSRSGNITVSSDPGTHYSGSSGGGYYQTLNVNVSHTHTYAHTHNTNSKGGDAAHNNIPPTVTVKLWKRTA